MSRDQRSSPRRKAAATGESDRLSLAELTDQAEVTVRTVRYYIAEGLLPPPASGGAQSHYTQDHLDRLRLIARLKDAYLPLREIRRRLAGLDDAAVRELLQDSPSRPRAPSPASDYLDQMLGAPQPRADPSRTRQIRADHQASPWEARAESDQPAAVFDDPDAAPQPRSEPIGAAAPLTPVPLDFDEQAAPDAWRRVRLGDDAELLIRESSYRERQDRIDWLIRWARRVFR